MDKYIKKKQGVGQAKYTHRIICIYNNRSRQRPDTYAHGTIAHMRRAGLAKQART